MSAVISKMIEESPCNTAEDMIAEVASQARRALENVDYGNMDKTKIGELKSEIMVNFLSIFHRLPEGVLASLNEGGKHAPIITCFEGFAFLKPWDKENHSAAIEIVDQVATAVSIRNENLFIRVSRSSSDYRRYFLIIDKWANLRCN